MRRRSIPLLWIAIVLATALNALAEPAGKAPSPARPADAEEAHAGQDHEDTGNVQSRELITEGKNPDVFLLYTGDVIGYTDPCG
jgi:hypothetical protein